MIEKVTDENYVIYWRPMLSPGDRFALFVGFQSEAGKDGYLAWKVPVYEYTDYPRFRRAGITSTAHNAKLRLSTIGPGCDGGTGQMWRHMMMLAAHGIPVELIEREFVKIPAFRKYFSEHPRPDWNFRGDSFDGEFPDSEYPFLDSLLASKYFTTNLESGSGA